MSRAYVLGSSAHVLGFISCGSISIVMLASLLVTSTECNSHPNLAIMFIQPRYPISFHPYSTPPQRLRTSVFRLDPRSTGPRARTRRGADQQQTSPSFGEIALASDERWAGLGERPAHRNTVTEKKTTVAKRRTIVE